MHSTRDESNHPTGDSGRFGKQTRTAGGAGDRAEVLERLLYYKAENVVFAGITDRPATDACYKAGVGATIPLSIGATLDPLGQ